MTSMFGKENPAFLHGMTNTRTFRCWANMLTRCTNPNFKHYKNYGGRGITVCKRWRKFNNFFKDMGICPPKHSIERLNNNSGYKPSNCCWATHEQQTRNARSNIKTRINGTVLCTAEWARIAGISKELLRYRIAAGWPVERLLIPPLHGGNPHPHSNRKRSP